MKNIYKLLLIIVLCISISFSIYFLNNDKWFYRSGNNGIIDFTYDDENYELGDKINLDYNCVSENCKAITNNNNYALIFDDDYYLYNILQKKVYKLNISNTINIKSSCIYSDSDNVYGLSLIKDNNTSYYLMDDDKEYLSGNYFFKCNDINNVLSKDKKILVTDTVDKIIDLSGKEYISGTRIEYKDNYYLAYSNDFGNIYDNKFNKINDNKYSDFIVKDSYIYAIDDKKLDKIDIGGIKTYKYSKIYKLLNDYIIAKDNDKVSIISFDNKKYSLSNDSYFDSYVKDNNIIVVLKNSDDSGILYTFNMDNGKLKSKVVNNVYYIGIY